MIGILFGTLICAAFAGGTFFGFWIHAHQGQKITVQSNDRADDLARQWANIMTYDGTERGQIGEDYGEE